MTVADRYRMTCCWSVFILQACGLHDIKVHKTITRIGYLTKFVTVHSQHYYDLQLVNPLLHPDTVVNHIKNTLGIKQKEAKKLKLVHMSLVNDIRNAYKTPDMARALVFIACMGLADRLWDDVIHYICYFGSAELVEAAMAVKRLTGQPGIDGNYDIPGVSGSSGDSNVLLFGPLALKKLLARAVNSFGIADEQYGDVFMETIGVAVEKKSADNYYINNSGKDIIQYNNCTAPVDNYTIDTRNLAILRAYQRIYDDKTLDYWIEEWKRPRVHHYVLTLPTCCYPYKVMQQIWTLSGAVSTKEQVFDIAEYKANLVQCYIICIGRGLHALNDKWSQDRNFDVIKLIALCVVEWDNKFEATGRSCEHHGI